MKFSITLKLAFPMMMAVSILNRLIYHSFLLKFLELEGVTEQSAYI